MKLSPDKKFDVQEVLKDLDKYRPRRKGWSWRKKVEDQRIGPFTYKDSSENLKQSVPLPAAEYFDNMASVTATGAATRNRTSPSAIALIVTNTARVRKNMVGTSTSISALWVSR